MRAHGLNFKRPQKPSLAPIALLHRPGDDEHSVSFARKTWFHGQECWEDVCNVPAKELREWFPELVDQLQEDSFYSVNGFMTPKRNEQPTRKSQHVPELAASCRRYPRWLCACYADLDGYKHGVSDGQLVGALLDMRSSGQLPPFSMLTLSGRGVWAFWFLRTEEGTGPVPYFPMRSLYAKVQRAIGSRLAHLHSDAQARDSARVTRIPGSRHTIAKRNVEYLVLYDEHGRPYLHTLSALAEFFGVRAEERPRAIAVLRGSDPTAQLQGLRGAIGRWRKDLQRFEALRELRGGFRQGCRAHALRLYAGMLFSLQRGVRRLPENKRPKELQHFADMSDREIADAVFKLAAECSPPFKASEAKPLYREAQRGKLQPMKHETITAQLGVTLEELEGLDAQGFGGWTAPNGERVGASGRVKAGRDEETARRREFVRDLVRRELANGGSVPTLASLQEALRPAGLSAAPRTLQKDLDALGIENPRAKGARKANRPQGATLFEAPETLASGPGATA